MPRLNTTFENRARGPCRPLPPAPQRADSDAAPAPGAGRPPHRGRHEPCRRARRHRAGRGAVGGVVLRDVQTAPHRPLSHRGLHEPRMPFRRCRGARRSDRGEASGYRRATPLSTGFSRSRPSSASPTATRRLAPRSTTATSDRSTQAACEALVGDLKAGRLDDVVPSSRHARPHPARGRPQGGRRAGRQGTSGDGPGQG